MDARERGSGVSATRVYLVRHGATALTTEDKFSGAIGVELSDDGRWQASKLGERLAKEGITAVYSSPLSRAVDTAHLIADRMGLTPTLRDGLREISHGRWEGLSRREVEAQFRDEYLSWESDPFTFAPEGGESGLAVLARSLPVIREVVTANVGQRILVVSHKATLRLMLSSLLGFDERGYRDRLDQAPACLNIVDFKDPVRARLMLFNDTSHYAGQTRFASFNQSKWWDDGKNG
jgi:broad specificity phosphatase PhoE